MFERLCAVAIMAKASVAGTVKTRLVPPLTPEEAAMLNTCCLADVAANIAAAAAQAPIQGFVAYDPLGSEQFFRDLLPVGFKLLPPRTPGRPPAEGGCSGGTLGRSLLHAVGDLLAAGYGSVCLVNADSPTLPTDLLVRAVRSLAEPGDRVVLGPAADGGYYLIGLKRFHPRLFEAIDWSTERVYRQTLMRADEIGLPVASLPEWYDVDDALTFAILVQELLAGSGMAKGYRGGYAAPSTAACLTELAATNGGVRRILAAASPSR
jgi:rSAM/selenodomain-associated transferase 1